MGRLGPMGLGTLKGRIPDLLGCGARVGSGFKSCWPTCRVGWGPLGRVRAMRDPEFDRKFDRMFEIVEGETGYGDCMAASQRCRRPALRE